MRPKYELVDLRWREVIPSMFSLIFQLLSCINNGNVAEHSKIILSVIQLKDNQAKEITQNHIYGYSLI